MLLQMQQVEKLLDDYEEDAWTPHILGSGSGFTMLLHLTPLQTLVEFQKIGRLVTFVDFKPYVNSGAHVVIGGYPLLYE